jgi:drug/metabolite transporter (DMT)-like permease
MFRKFSSPVVAVRCVVRAIGLAGVDAAAPTPSPTTHHTSKTGGYFGVACFIFLMCVAAFTYFYNMQSINAMCCGSPKRAMATEATQEMTH